MRQMILFLFEKLIVLTALSQDLFCGYCFHNPEYSMNMNLLAWDQSSRVKTVHYILFINQNQFKRFKLIAAIIFNNNRQLLASIKYYSFCIIVAVLCAFKHLKDMLHSATHLLFCTKSHLTNNVRKVFVGDGEQ